MKTIKVGQIVMVATLSLSVLACSGGGGGSFSVSTTPSVAPSNPDNSNPSDNTSPADGGTLPQVPAGQAKMVSQDQQSLEENGGQVTIRGEYLDLVNKLRLKSINTSTVVDVDIVAQNPADLQFDGSGLPANNAYKIFLVDAGGAESDTGRYVLSASEMLQVKTGQYTMSTTNGCMVMKDTSLRCFGKGEVVQFQGSINSPKSSSYVNVLSAWIFGHGFYNYDMATDITTPAQYDASLDGLQIKGNSETTSYIIRDANNNPVLGVAEVAVFQYMVCYRKIDNTVFCFGGNGNASSFTSGYNDTILEELTRWAITNMKTLADMDLRNNLINPRQLLDSNGNVVKVTSLGTNLGQWGFCGIKETSGSLFCWNNLRTTSNPTYNNSLIYPQSISGQIVKMSSSTFFKTDFTTLNSINNVNSNLKSFSMGAYSRHYTNSLGLFMVSDDFTKVYACSSDTICSQLVYSANTAADRVQSIKANANNVCIRDVSNRIKCLGEKIFSGYNVASGTDTKKTFMDYVGKDVSISKAAALADAAWDIGVLGEWNSVTSLIDVKMWGMSDSGNFLPYVKVTNNPKGTADTTYSSATVQSYVDTINSYGNGTLVYNVLPKTMVHSYTNEIPNF